MKQKIFLLGAGGFWGKHLSTYFKAKAEEYDCIDIGSPLDGFTADYTLSLDTVGGQIKNFIDRFEPTIIINLVGISSGPKRECYEVNTFFSLDLMHAIRGTSIVLILIGTAAEYGTVTEDMMPLPETAPLRPVSDYGISKAAQWFHMRQEALLYGSDIRLARVFNLIGESLSEKLAPGGFAHRIATLQKDGGTSLRVGNLQPKRDYIGVSLASRMLEAIMNNGSAGEIYNICSGYSITMESLVQTMLEKAGMHTSALEVDRSLLKGFDIRDIYGSTEKIAALLPISRQELEHAFSEDLNALLVGAGVTLV